MNSIDIEKLNSELNNSKLVNLRKEVFQKIWNEHQHDFKYMIGLRLYQYAYGKHYDYTTSILPKNQEDVRKHIIWSYRKSTERTNASSRAKRFQRLAFGYYGLTYELTPKRCNLSSLKANQANSKDTVADHIIGATLCSEYIKLVFKQGKKGEEIDWVNIDWLNERVEFMCNEWLQDNLWLWAQCRITKTEHNPKYGVRRSIKAANIENEIKDRVNLRHYFEIEEPIKVRDYS